MRILLTGGAGFIGRWVAERYVAAGHEVRIVDCLLPDTHAAGEPPDLPAGVEFVRGDLRDPDTVADVVRGVDVVNHHAAVVGRGQEILDARHHVSCNDLGTANLLVAMVRAGIRRMVLASTVAIYGDSRYDCPTHGRVRPPRRTAADLDAGRYEPVCGECGGELRSSAVTEDEPLDPPRNIYAVTKLAQEYLVGTWANEVGGSAVALRYHNVYGPGMPYQSPYSGVVAVFRSAAERGEAAELYEDGGSLRDFIDVRDIAAANEATLGWSRPGFRAFNVASGRPQPISAVARAVAAARSAPAPVVTGKYRIGDVRHVVASPDRLLAETRWRPAIDFETGMKEFALTPMRGLPNG
jgi:dTDP-L-rhamnose 4-epimerase